MRNAGLEEVEAGIKIAGRNINNFRYADDTTRMAESEDSWNNRILELEGTLDYLWLDLPATLKPLLEKHCSL